MSGQLWFFRDEKVWYELRKTIVHKFHSKSANRLGALQTCVRNADQNWLQQRDNEKKAIRTKIKIRSYIYGDTLFQNDLFFEGNDIASDSI